MGLFGRKSNPENEIVDEVSIAEVSTPPPPPAKKKRQQSAYSIDDAIRLMRSLPMEQDPDLVVRVVKTTLESVNVRVSAIVGQADQKESTLRESIGRFETENDELKRQIDLRLKEIERLQNELNETSRVKELLRGAAESEASAGDFDFGVSSEESPEVPIATDDA